MKKVKENIRVYAILQRNDDDSVELCGCYTDYNVAEKICKRLNKIYTQEYYIVSYYSPNFLEKFSNSQYAFDKWAYCSRGNSSIFNNIYNFLFNSCKSFLMLNLNPLSFILFCFNC